jgi:hypothetical protein
MLSHDLLLVLGVISAAMLIYRVTIVVVRQVREVVSLNNDTQRYFAIPHHTYAWFKRNIQYAPIFRKRHNREFQLSSALNMGTLPTRLQLAFLLGYFATNVALCVITIDYSGPFRQVCALVRNRTGYLAVINMIPLFIFAGRNNPLIPLLGMSFDTFNLLHRWMGRIVMLESVAHTLAFLISNASANGWAAAFRTATTVPYMLWGFLVSAFPLLDLELAVILTYTGHVRLRRPMYSGRQYLSPRLLRNIQVAAYWSRHPRRCWSLVPPPAQGPPAAALHVPCHRDLVRRSRRPVCADCVPQLRRGWHAHPR